MFRNKLHSATPTNFFSLSAKGIKKICKESTNNQLIAAINLLNNLLEQPSKIEVHFERYVGYPSRKAAIIGIKAYAAGEARAIQQGEDTLTSLENLAKLYIQLTNAKLKLESHLAALTDELHQRSEQTSATSKRI